ncbi:MAG: hypothetical protein DDT19_01353 [Syntrophomonadaceae bacterium]|nr:hypothetical protein [Bacillota bacterium]
MEELYIQLARIETKLDAALATLCDHEQRLRGLERGNPHNSNSKIKGEIIRLLVGALLALAGVGAGRWVWR